LKNLWHHQNNLGSFASIGSGYQFVGARTELKHTHTQIAVTEDRKVREKIYFFYCITL